MEGSRPTISSRLRRLACEPGRYEIISSTGLMQLSATPSRCTTDAGCEIRVPEVIEKWGVPPEKNDRPAGAEGRSITTSGRSRIGPKTAHSFWKVWRLDTLRGPPRSAAEAPRELIEKPRRPAVEANSCACATTCREDALDTLVLQPRRIEADRLPQGDGVHHAHPASPRRTGASRRIEPLSRRCPEGDAPMGRPRRRPGNRRAGGSDVARPRWTCPFDARPAPTAPPDAVAPSRRRLRTIRDLATWRLDRETREVGIAALTRDDVVIRAANCGGFSIASAPAGVMCR